MQSERHIKNFEPLAGHSFDAIHHHINIFGTYEDLEFDVVKNFLQNNLTGNKLALDVGANIGNHTARLLSSIFENVLCYEPNHKIHTLLKLNMESFPNVKVFNYGLSDSSKMFSFYTDKTNWAAARIMPDEESFSDRKNSYTKIEVRSLDEVGIECSVDLIKVDIEGHEL